MEAAEPVSAPASVRTEELEEPAAESMAVQGPAPTAETPDTIAVQAPMPSRQGDRQVQARQQAEQNAMRQNENQQMPRQQGAGQQWQQAMPQMMTPQTMMPQTMMPQMMTQQGRTGQQSFGTPLTYQQMTPYMEQVTITESGSTPSINVPQTPLITEDFSETIDITDVQAYLGFLRTQIGRYMRIEQLIGSDTIENRYGFLVGIGTNFIILQEITTGNIMVIDLFSIRLTYIYYSEPVLPILPELMPQ